MKTSDKSKRNATRVPPAKGPGDGTAGKGATWCDRIRRPGKSVVQTSIRMCWGTRETLNYVRHILNQNRLAHEPMWSLGEVIELVIDDAYEPWAKIRRVISQNPLLPVRDKARVKSEPALKRAKARGCDRESAGHSSAV